MMTLITQNPAMKSEKIYEYEFDITGVTDYGVKYWMPSSPVKNRFDRRERVLTSRLPGAARVVCRGGRTSFTIC